MSNQYRKIIHVDMDAFYASVEQRDHPELRGKPIAVGGSGGRGVVMTASYEARKFGVRSAMPAHMARERCPDIIFVKSRMDMYREASDRIREIFLSYTDKVEPLSLDEAYLDVTTNKRDEPYASELAKRIRQDIYDETGLTASAGVSYNKFLAKLASDYNKPNGQTVIRPDQAQDFLDALPIEKFHGVGKVTSQKMRHIGVVNGKTLKEKSLETLVDRFGKVGRYYYHIVRGIDDREVTADRIRKSVGVERTFSGNIADISGLKEELDNVIERLLYRLKNVDREGFTLTLKLKTTGFEIINRSITAESSFRHKAFIEDTAYALMKMAVSEGVSYRLIGLKVSNFKDEGNEGYVQPELAL